MAGRLTGIARAKRGGGAGGLPFTSRSTGTGTGWAAAMVGLVTGLLISLIVFAPATWLASAVSAATGERLALLQPRGTVWKGAGQLVLSGGAASLDRLALAQDIHWRLGWAAVSGEGWGLRLSLQHPEAAPLGIELEVFPRWRHTVVQVGAQPDGAPARATLPASWLAGLGAPWNTLEPTGTMTLQVQRLRLDVGGDAPPALDARLRLQLANMGSRVSTLPVLGHYELQAQGQGTLTMQLSSRPDSALLLSGQGVWNPRGKVEFRGEARAAEGREAALANLLNIIGRRDGPRSVITI